MRLSPAYICQSAYIHGNDQLLIEDVSSPVYVNQKTGVLNNPAVQRGLVYAPHMLASELLKNLDLSSNTPRERRAFILAAGNSRFGGESWGRAPKHTFLDINYRFLPLLINQIYGGKIANEISYDGFISTDATACASSLKSLHDAQILLSLGEFDEVAILTIEDQICYGTVDFFTSTKACLTQKDFVAGNLPSAFDLRNHGFILGHGAAFAVLANEVGVRNNQKSPRAVITSTAVASEIGNATISPQTNGAGYMKAMQKVLNAQNLNPKDVSLIKTHGTGTKANNLAEQNAIVSIFGDHFVATGYKSAIGHTLGVSGLLETLISIDEAINGKISPIANRISEDDRFISHPYEGKVSRILSLASGMGNIYASSLCQII